MTSNARQVPLEKALKDQAKTIFPPEPRPRLKESKHARKFKKGKKEKT